MKSLSLNQMENVEGGAFNYSSGDCWFAVSMFAVATVGLVTLTAATGGLVRL
jgi:hypothetical protein